MIYDQLISGLGVFALLLLVKRLNKEG